MGPQSKKYKAVEEDGDDEDREEDDEGQGSSSAVAGQAGEDLDETRGPDRSRLDDDDDR